MKPSSALHLRINKSRNLSTKADAIVARKHTNDKNKQLEAAINWCKKFNGRGQAALKTGLFPLIKDRETINRRLDGKVIKGKERDYCTILTDDEEASIVRFIKNKNRCLQAINKQDITKLIINVLRVRDYTNTKMKGGRKFQKLSLNARAALEKGKLSRSFWLRFNAKHSSLTIKRQGSVSINRALNCSREMACNHLDSLAKELVDVGIMINEKMIETVVWNGTVDTCRIFNCDETPQFINYGIDGTTSGLFYAGKGDACQRMYRENRECVTLQPFVSFSGDICMCQVIFKCTGITSSMVPTEAVNKISHLLVTTTDNGVSTHESFLAALKEFDVYINEKNVKRPIVLLSDGHSSRLDFDVLSFLESKRIHLFLTPPETTEVTQLLDQVNKNIHSEYRKQKDSMFSDICSLNKEAFMLVLANIWDKWTTKETLVKSAKRVGVAENALSVDFMQKDKFERAENCIEPEKQTSPLISSPDKRRGSANYWKSKFEQAMELIDELHEKSIQLEEIPGFMTTKKIKPKLTKDATRVTQVHGSMTASDVITLVESIKRKKEKEKEKKENAAKKKEEVTRLFITCKLQCYCKEIKCKAFGLKQCPTCLNIMRSICSKANCKVNGKNPEMILSAAARKK
ncbi:uncharacterized protein LOC136072675 [Hydra vulgaris]